MMKMNSGFGGFENPSADDFNLDTSEGGASHETQGNTPPSLEEMEKDPKYQEHLAEWPDGPDTFLDRSEMKDAEIYEHGGRIFFLTPDRRMFNENLEMVNSGKRIEVLENGKIVQSKNKAA